MKSHSSFARAIRFASASTPSRFMCLRPRAMSIRIATWCGSAPLRSASRFNADLLQIGNHPGPMNRALSILRFSASPITAVPFPGRGVLPNRFLNTLALSLFLETKCAVCESAFSAAFDCRSAPARAPRAPVAAVCRPRLDRTLREPADDDRPPERLRHGLRPDARHQTLLSA